MHFRMHIAAYLDGYCATTLMRLKDNIKCHLLYKYRGHDLCTRNEPLDKTTTMFVVTTVTCYFIMWFTIKKSRFL